MPQDAEEDDDKDADGKIAERAGGKKAEHVRVKVVKMTKPLDRGRAIRVYKLWARMLKGVRYADGGSFTGWFEDFGQV